MRLLVLGAGWFPDDAGGLSRYIRELLGALETVGVDARAVVLGPGADAPPNVRVVSDTQASLPVRLAALRRAAAVEAPGADVVDAHFALTALPAVLGPLRGKPLVVHFQGPWAGESAVEGAPRAIVAAKRFVERAVYRRAARVIVLSEAFAELVVRYGVPRERILVIPPGVDLERFSPGDRAEARRALDLPEEGRVVAVVRRLVPRMGLDVLLEAWRRSDNGVLAIAGDGPERAALERIAPAGVRFLGRVSEDDLIALYRASDVCAVPSIAFEGFGLVVLEALACGTPVVVSDIGGLPEAVRDLDPTLVVPAGDAAALAARLAAPLPSREECRAHAERFSWTAAAERHRAVYEAVASPRLRVVYLDHTAVLSGGELALARLLPALDVDAHVLLAEDGPLAARLREAGTTVEVLELAESARGLPREAVGRGAVGGALRSVFYAVRLARRLRVLQPDIVHTNSLKSGLYGGLAARLARVPCVWHLRDRIAPDYLPPAAVRLVRLAARVFPAAVIADTNATLATLPRARRAHVVPSPVAVSAATRRRKPGPLRVGIVGRIAPWKGQHVFLEAFAQAFPDGEQLAVVVGTALFGEDEQAYADGLQEQANLLGLAARVEFTGFRVDVAAELARLDVLVHASVLPEPFGQVVVEGMAAGLAVVASDAGGPAEIVEPESTGLLFPPGDSAALAAALRRLDGDRALRQRLGAAARERARAFAPEVVAADVLAVYRSVL